MKWQEDFNSLNKLSEKVTPKNVIITFKMVISLDSLSIEQAQLNEFENDIISNVQEMSANSNIKTSRPIVINKGEKEVKKSSTKISLSFKYEDYENADTTLLSDYLTWLNTFCQSKDVGIIDIKTTCELKQGKVSKEEETEEE